MDILDTAGQEEFSVMREMYMRTGEGFLLVYSVTSRQSFEEVASFYNQILRVKDADRVPLVLVGNKCDLEIHRQVMTSEGQTLASSWGVPFFEASAFHRTNVDESFHQLIREIRNDRQARRNPNGAKSRKPKSNAVKKAVGACNIL